MKTQIEFTDRYGGRTPSWLRSCHGDCEAMGVVPVSNPLADLQVDHGPHKYYYVDKWWDAENKEHAEDGWHFVKCPECHGTGRVSWWIALSRIPRWLVKGTQFCFQCGNLTDMPWHKSLWLRIKCAFVLDLLRLRN
jgi:hypothetical protein